MKKLLISLLAGTLLWSACTEVPLIVDTTERGKDTTYVTTPELPQTKMILVEELSGVECVNCPAGAQLLEDANESGPAAGRLIIATIHAGDLTRPINKDGKVSQFDLRTDVGLQIITTVLGGDIGKPCSAFDRLPLSSVTPGGLLDYRNKWENMISKALEEHSTTPINVSVSSQKLEENSYAIQVKVSYTEDITGKQALSVYLTEDGIEDYQMFPSETKKYEFKHTFRGTLSPFNGMEILSDLAKKEKGRVFIQEFILDIDPSDVRQADWKPENMHVIAFVHKIDESDKSVYQAAEVKLAE